jgi:hypothetical protein
MIKLMMMMEVMEVVKEQGLLEGGSVLIASLAISYPFGASQRRQDDAGSLVRRVNLCAFVSEQQSTHCGRGTTTFFDCESSNLVLSYNPQMSPGKFHTT